MSVRHIVCLNYPHGLELDCMMPLLRCMNPKSLQNMNILDFHLLVCMPIMIARVFKMVFTLSMNQECLVTRVKCKKSSCMFGNHASIHVSS